MQLADCLSLVKDYPGALSLYERAITTVAAVHAASASATTGENAENGKGGGIGNAVSLAAIYDKCGLLLFRNGDFSRAELYFTRSLALREKIHRFPVLRGGQAYFPFAVFDFPWLSVVSFVSLVRFRFQLEEMERRAGASCWRCPVTWILHRCRTTFGPR